MADEKKRLNAWDKLMMAITFAEAGEAKTAKDILDNSLQKRPEDRKDKRPELRV